MPTLPIPEQYGGIIPKIANHDPKRLPPGAAQTAENVDLTSGALVPIDVDAPFNELNDGADMKGEIAVADIHDIPKPDAPSYVESDKFRFASPATWFDVTARVWLSYMDRTAGAEELVYEDLASAQGLSYKWTRYSKRGIEVTFSIARFTKTFVGGGPFFIRGPKYQFDFTPGSGNYNGGPDDTTQHPDTATPSDPEFVRCAIPLYIPTDWVNYPAAPPVTSIDLNYATLEVVDVIGPNWDEDYYDPAVPSWDWDPFEGVANINITFICRMNYTDPNTRVFYYMQSMVKDVAGDEFEGPVSELSTVVQLDPGQGIKMTTPLEATYTKNRLYRSASSVSGFRLLQQHEAAQFYDAVTLPLTDELEDYGELPDTPANLAVGSVLHPAQFAVYYVGATIYPTLPEKPWVTPEEYAITFDSDILALAVTGNSVLVWTEGASGDDGRVYMVSGSNPRALIVYDLAGTDVHPLLNKLGLCRLGQLLIWPSHNGLMAAGEGLTVQNLTSEHYTRTEWLDASPGSMTAKTADNSVFLTVAGGTNLRVDVEEQLARVSTWTATSGVDLTYRSPRFYFPHRLNLSCARIAAEAFPVTFKLYNRGREVHSQFVLNDNPFKLPRLSPGAEWSWEVESGNTVYRVEVATNMRELTPSGQW